jgi:hypothetical protein
VVCLWLLEYQLLSRFPSSLCLSLSFPAVSVASAGCTRSIVEDGALPTNISRRQDASGAGGHTWTPRRNHDMPVEGGMNLAQGATRFYATIGGRSLRCRLRALRQREWEVPVEKVYGTITLRVLESHCSPRASRARSDGRIMDRVNRGGCAEEGARVFRAGAATDQAIRYRGGAVLRPMTRSREYK